MQGLSSRAHAFSVEALVGKPCKRMKVCEGHEPKSDTDRGSDPSIFTGQRKKAGSAPSRRSEPELESEEEEEEEEEIEAAAGGEEDKPRESNCRPDREIRVELQGSELWKRFYEIGTEMIITKAGRFGSKKQF